MLPDALITKGRASDVAPGDPTMRYHPGFAPSNRVIFVDPSKGGPTGP